MSSRDRRPRRTWTSPVGAGIRRLGQTRCCAGSSQGLGGGGGAWAASIDVSLRCGAGPGSRRSGGSACRSARGSGRGSARRSSTPAPSGSRPGQHGAQPADGQRRPGTLEVADDLPLHGRGRDDARLHDVVPGRVRPVQERVEERVADLDEVVAGQGDEHRPARARRGGRRTAPARSAPGRRRRARGPRRRRGRRAAPAAGGWRIRMRLRSSPCSAMSPRTPTSAAATTVRPRRAPRSSRAAAAASRIGRTAVRGMRWKSSARARR